MNLMGLLPWLAWPIVLAPAVALVAFGLVLLGRVKIAEQPIAQLSAWAGGLSLLGTVATGLVLSAERVQHVSVSAGAWIDLPDFKVTLTLFLDAFSLAFASVSAILCSVIGAFARRYLHREQGFGRFYLMYLTFQLGMAVAVLAGNIETLFAGWELVGLSSAMLVAFFHDRPSPPRNGLRIWAVYRISDAALLAAAIAMHQLSGHGEFDKMLISSEQAGVHETLTSWEAFFIGTLLLIAAAGKSALIPFSGWLPRAMEGPTPSSAVFYGALSVHLGAYLLLRVEPILQQSPALRMMIVVLGLSTAAFASLATRVHADVKSILSFASLTQVGLIVAEIGLGFSGIALVHLVGHACFRTLQFLRAPNVLHDRHQLENAVGGHLHAEPLFPGLKLAPEALHWWYRIGLDQGGFDSFLERMCVAPLHRLLNDLDGWERRVTDWLSGGPSRRSDENIHHTGGMEEWR